MHIYPVIDSVAADDRVDVRLVDSFGTVHHSERVDRERLMNALFHHNARFNFYDVVMHTSQLVSIRS